MAEFCEECFRNIFAEQLKEDRPILSLYKDICEECGQYKRVVVRVAPARRSLWRELKTRL